MKRVDTQDVRAHYQELFRKYGSEDVRSVHWNSEESQFERFMILCQIGNMQGCRVLDAGCGKGDFLSVLAERYPTANYSGLDLSPDFIQFCKTEYPGHDFYCANLLDPLPGQFDWIVASGTFGYAIDNYRNLYFEAIQNMLNYASKGVAVNLLNARTHDDDPLYATFDPLDVHQFAIEVCDRFIIRQDYNEHDMTLYLYK